jgi:hypothetical protein
MYKYPTTHEKGKSVATIDSTPKYKQSLKNGGYEIHYHGNDSTNNQ